MSKFTFIDLFAGIGGFRIAMESLGGKCVFSCEIDKFARKTYYANYNVFPFGDIRDKKVKSIIPNGFDVLCAGFPCQSFSIAGKRLGFNDETRGTLFFEIEEILREKQPKAFLLENVKGLASNNGGKTLRIIIEHLERVGYDVIKPQILNSKDFGVPQQRERIYIVGFRKDLNIDSFDFPRPNNIKRTFIDIREKEKVDSKYYITEKYLSWLEKHKQTNRLKGNGFGYSIIGDNDIANTLMVGGMGIERNLVIDERQTDSKNKQYIRKMTPREWARLQGFPEEFKIVVSDTQAYKQFGNSVSIPTIKAIGENIINNLYTL